MLLKRKKYLKMLPLQKRLQAIENIRKQYTWGIEDAKNTLVHNQSVLSGAFDFSQTRQGHSYWYDIQDKYFNGL